jgi:hypothetical protein
LSILDPAIGDFKASAREFLYLADAVILHRRDGTTEWKNVSGKLLQTKPAFYISPPPYVTDELAAWVREHLAHTTGNRDAKIAMN